MDCSFIPPISPKSTSYYAFAVNIVEPLSVSDRFSKTPTGNKCKSRVTLTKSTTDSSYNVNLVKANKMMKEGLENCTKFPDMAYKLLVTAGKAFAEHYYNRDAFVCYTNTVTIQLSIINNNLCEQKIKNCSMLSFIDLLTGPVCDLLNENCRMDDEKLLTYTAQNFVGNILIVLKSSLYAARIAKNYSKKISKKLYLQALYCVAPMDVMEKLSSVFGTSEMLSIDSPYLPSVSTAMQNSNALKSLPDVCFFYCTTTIDNLKRVIEFIQQKCQKMTFDWIFFSDFLEEISGFLCQSEASRISLVLYELLVQINSVLLERTDVVIKNLRRLLLLYNRLKMRAMELNTMERLLSLVKSSELMLEILQKLLSQSIAMDDQKRVDDIMRTLDEQNWCNFKSNESIQKILAIARANASCNLDLLCELEWQISDQSKLLSIFNTVKDRIHAIMSSR